MPRRRDSKFYKPIYALMNLGRFQLALNLIYDRRGSGVRRQYRSDLNHAWYMVASLHYELRQYNLAARASRRAIFFDPYDDWAYLILGNCFDERRQADGARQVFERAMNFCPTAAIKYDLANAYFDLAAYDEAIKLYEQIESSDDDIFDMAQLNAERARLRQATPRR